MAFDDVAVTLAVPIPQALITPAAVTVTTPVLEDAHVTVFVVAFGGATTVRLHYRVENCTRLQVRVHRT